MDLNLDSDKAYRAEVRVTETRGFGGSSLSQSFSRGTPEEVTNHRSWEGLASETRVTHLSLWCVCPITLITRELLEFLFNNEFSHTLLVTELAGEGYKRV